jgi:hypothetical protein
MEVAMMLAVSTVGVGSATAVPLQAVSKNKARMKILVIPEFNKQVQL